MLTLSGELWVDVAAQPLRLHFGQLQPGQSAKRPLSLVVTKPEAVEVKRVSLADERFTVEPMASADRGRRSYEVTFSGSKKLGAIQAALVVDYTGPDGAEQLEVPIFCQVAGDLRYPRSTSLQKVGGRYQPETLVVASRSNKPVRILSAKDPDGLLAVDVIESKGAQAKVRLSVPEGREPTSSGGKVELQTNDPLEPLVTISYTLQTAQRRRGLGPRQPLGSH